MRSQAEKNAVMQGAMRSSRFRRASDSDSPSGAFGKPSEESAAKLEKTWKSRIRGLWKTQSVQFSPARKNSLRPTAEEVHQWSESFDKLLSHKYGQAAFRIYLKSEYCEENMEFWLACQDFQRITSQTKLTSRAHQIFEEFIRSKSPKEVNLDFHTKAAIAQDVRMPTPSCFLKAQTKIYSLMENHCYPRFIESELYRELLKAARGNI